ncbi:hypothetical protein D3C73_1320210 [compost metagenome]
MQLQGVQVLIFLQRCGFGHCRRLLDQFSFIKVTVIIISPKLAVAVEFKRNRIIAYRDAIKIAEEFIPVAVAVRQDAPGSPVLGELQLAAGLIIQAVDQIKGPLLGFGLV